MRNDFSDILEKCVEIALKSGEIIKDTWNKPRFARHKGTIDLVTATDVEVQEFFRQALATLLPEAAFLGEEGEAEKPDPYNSLCWIVDPIDGTTNFVHRFPMVATSIGLWNMGQPVFGVVHAPMLGELFSGGPGLGAFCNGEPVRVSKVGRLIEALVSTGFPYDITPELNDILRRMARVLPATQGLRRPGCASLDLSFLACGRIDAYYEHTLKPWDVAGGIAILLEAGGAISAFSGQPYKFGLPLLASNGILHEAMSALLRETSKNP